MGGELSKTSPFHKKVRIIQKGKRLNERLHAKTKVPCYPDPFDPFLLTWDTSRQIHSPRRMFAYWGRSEMLKFWVNDFKIKLDGFAMRLALNMPTSILRDFRKWYKAQTDEEYKIIVPWDDFNLWCRQNGFSGKVSCGPSSDWSP